MISVIRVSACLIFSMCCIFSFGQSGNHVVNYDSFVKIERNKRIEIKSYLIQIDNQASDWISDIEIPFSKNDQIEILEAAIIGPKGNIVRNLKKKEVITRNDISYGSFYEDDFIKEFKLKWHEYPYRIRYSYKRTTDQFLYVKRWYPYIYSSVNTKKATLRAEVPKNYSVIIDSSDGLKYEADTTGNTYQYYWEAKDIKPIKREAFSPPLIELIPRVTIIPNIFQYAIEGSFESWATYGNWHTLLNKNLDQLTTAEALKVDQLIKGISDKKEIIKILYHYMQDNTRYINVAIDVGGLKPYPASYVCTNKYGDCKALTIYMKAMLKYAGLESYYTVIYGSRNPLRINQDYPGQQFNHVILAVPLAQDTVWLENTSQISPYNYLGSFTHDRYALLVNGKNSRLLKTPPLTDKNVLNIATYKFDLNAEGGGTLAITNELHGPSFERYNEIQELYSSKEQKRILQNLVKIKNTDLTDWSFNQVDRDQDQINVKLNLTVKNQFRKLGKSLVLMALPANLIDFEKPDKRKTPVRINYPINREDSIIYKMNFLSLSSIRLPMEISVKSDFGLFKQSYGQEGNQIIVKRTFQLYKGDYSLEVYPELYAFFELIKKQLKQSAIILNPT